MVQILPIALAQEKAGNTFEKLRSKLGRIIYFLYRAKEVTKKIYITIQWIQQSYKTKLIYKFMDFKNSKKSDPHRLLLNFSGKINWKKSDKHVALPNFSIFYTWKNIRKSY